MHIPTHTDIVRRRLHRGLATGLLFTQSALLALAQTAPADTKEEKEKVVVMEAFEVTGTYASSLAAAAQAKQQSPAIVEVIMAEDIGKLPDVSIADSLTRLTGLATQRTNGRSQAISIRGLTGDFSTGMLNGREQVSTGLNRAVEFDQYPAELLNEVTVYKTANASLTQQGLAGTIDLRTVKPLSKSGRTIAMNGYYNWTELGELTPGAKTDGERINFAYIDQLADGKVGVAFGFSHTSTPFQGEQFQAWGYDNPGGFLLGGTKSYVRSSFLERQGFLGVLEFKPNSRVHSTFDIYSSKFEEKQLLRGLELPLAPNWTNWRAGGTTLVSSTVTGGYYSKAVIGNVKPVVRNDSFVRDDDLIAFGWNLKIGDGEGWTTTFDAGYSKVERKDTNVETWSGLGGAFNPAAPGDTITVELRPGDLPRFTTTVDYSNSSLFRLADPQGWGPGSLPGGGMTGYLKGFDSRDELGQFKLFTERELSGFFNRIEIGASYTDRYKRDGEKPSGFLFNANGQSAVALPTIIGFTDMSFLGFKPIYAYDPFAPVNSGTLGFSPNADTGIVANRWSVREKILRPYVQLDIATKVGEMPLTGNVGVQAIEVDQSSSGLSASGTLLTPVTAGDKYTDFAPSLNLILEPRESLVLRFSAARQLARPRMFDMKASRTWGYDATKAGQSDPRFSPWSGGGGNSLLRPWKADSVDLSLEKYFQKNRGYISLTAFHKKLLNYIYEQTAFADFSGYPVTSGPQPTLRQGSVTQPVNGNGGVIKGLEATLSLSSELFNPEIKGFGLIVGGAYTDSSVQPWGPGNGNAPIAGLSRKVANATLYFERAGFSARVSQRYRSEYRAYITTFGPPNFKGDVAPNGDFAVTQPETVLDAQVSYTLQGGRFKGLTAYVQAYNLNNEPLITYEQNDPRRVKNYQQYGASYSAGLSYKF
jgi:iron complex outermembrane recepter protein